MESHNNKTFTLDVNTFFVEPESYPLPQYLTDINLASVTGSQHRGNRLILSLASPYLARLIEFNVNRGAVEGAVIATAVPANVLEQLLQYLHTGRLALTDNEIPAFLQAASDLQVTSLAAEAEEFLQTNTPDVTLTREETEMAPEALEILQRQVSTEADTEILDENFSAGDEGEIADKLDEVELIADTLGKTVDFDSTICQETAEADTLLLPVDSEAPKDIDTELAEADTVLMTETERPVQDEATEDLGEESEEENVDGDLELDETVIVEDETEHDAKKDEIVDNDELKTAQEVGNETTEPRTSTPQPTLESLSIMPSTLEAPANVEEEVIVEAEEDLEDSGMDVDMDEDTELQIVEDPQQLKENEIAELETQICDKENTSMTVHISRAASITTEEPATVRLFKEISNSLPMLTKASLSQVSKALETQKEQPKTDLDDSGIEVKMEVKKRLTLVPRRVKDLMIKLDTPKRLTRTGRKLRTKRKQRILPKASLVMGISSEVWSCNTEGCDYWAYQKHAMKRHLKSQGH